MGKIRVNTESCEGRGIEGSEGDAQVKDEMKESSSGTNSTVILRRGSDRRVYSTFV